MLNYLINLKKHFYEISRKNLVVWKSGLRLLSIIAIIAFSTSCKKSSTSPTVNFAGTYYGTMTSGVFNEPDTITIPASSSSAIVMTSKTGAGSSYNINGTTNGSNISIASQSVYVPVLAATYTVTGSGTLSNSTLAISYVFVNSSNVTSNWTFNGTKH